MKKVVYPKGNAMTFPLEFAQIRDEEEQVDLKYLYPIETASIQKMVTEVCDQMEYDGSMMYDRFPDKVTIGRIADSICCHQRQTGDACMKGCKNGAQKPRMISDTSCPCMKALVEIMLTHEMDCRRNRRERHRN